MRKRRWLTALAMVALWTPCALAQSTLFGLNQEPLGQALVESVGGQLVVSNIGSSGDDGVRVDLGDAEGLTVQTVGFIDPLTAPQDAFFEVGGTSLATGSRSSVRYTVEGGVVRVRADFSEHGTDMRTVECYCGETLVGTVTHAGDWDLELPTAMGGTYQNVCNGGPGSDNTQTYTWVCLPGGGGG